MAMMTDASSEAGLQTTCAAADLTELQMRAYALGEMIRESALAEEYARRKEMLARDEAAQQAKKRLAAAKEKFAECERFGRYHPDYHEALKNVKAAEAEVNALESVRLFKEAERRMDELLHEVALILARAVSDSVKVPGDGDAPGGCGGSCSCGGCR